MNEKIRVKNVIKVIYGLALFAVATTASAIPVNFVKHQLSTGGSGTIVTTLISAGNSLRFRLPPEYGGLPGAVTASFDWDGTTLTSVGNYGVAEHINSNPNAGAVFAEKITDLSIDTSTSTASATAYQCNSGDFLLGVGWNICGGYRFGLNYLDDSTAAWSGTTASLTLGGDDVFAGGPRTISSYDFQLISWDGATLIIGNGMPLGAGGEQIMFSTIPVPAAAWLFGSALCLLGWVRRKTA